MHKDERESMPEARITSFSLSEKTCASSDGGPGLNLDEQRAGRSRLGTVYIYS